MAAPIASGCGGRGGGWAWPAGWRARVPPPGAGGGEADGKRLGIRGGSAGGWTALAAVTSGVGIARVVRDAEETGMVGQTPGLEGASGPEARGVFAAAASDFGG